MALVSEDSVPVAITVWLIISTLFTLLIFTLPSQYNPQNEESASGTAQSGSGPKKKTSVQIVVLGDIGRSPRMQYHALSVAKHGGRVDIIGYRDSDVHPDIERNSLIRIISIKGPPAFLQTSSKVVFPIVAPLKVIWQIWSLYHALGYRVEPSRWMLVQNPPSIPTLMVARFICFVRCSRLVVDWHNFGYSILALKLGQGHPLVKLSELYENVVSQTATAHFAVTNAMSRTLKRKFGINSESLHDRPADIFQPLSKEARNDFLEKLPETRAYASDIRKGITRLIVSSTSWTPDEDFSVLLDALVQYSEAAKHKSTLPKVLAIITGKGPLKVYYTNKINALKEKNLLDKVTFLTAWLSAKDYASLLGSADLGISLHTSSSGVDLPMKVVDMFGAGLPVLGWSDFEAWGELVKEDFNGKGFKSARELGDMLTDLFGPNRDHIETLREGAIKECSHRWDDEWDIVAGKLFKLTS